ncbi:MAG: hypothetical protein OQJ89_07655 [Kangiellaceae bacterium]|nr:hypothetical protein [Kangiellaceae bacterium]MCW8997734.1 hypothetical protein [Kangiellaceae bacterium]MCW9016821.1 hypothetical protein [Kangiellaceae bacterium]
MKTLTVYLPEISAHELIEQGLFHEFADKVIVEALEQDWQTYLSEEIGFESDLLPMTLLMAEQFQLSKNINTAISCEPVLVQMTHRGAYMIGQGQLELTPNDAIRIVTKVNEVLMNEGEQLYLVDQNRWLFTSEKKIELQSELVTNLIGKDLFNYQYQGRDSEYFQKLNTEIQMLIKQMADYGDLPQATAETVINVHFSDAINLEAREDVAFIKNDNICILTENELMKSFCVKTFLKHQSLSDVESLESAINVAIALDSEKELYPEVVGLWLHTYQQNLKNPPVIVCQDSTITFEKPKSLLGRLLGN